MPSFSPRTIELIQATVPLLRQHGEAITRHFYQLMFREHPEVKAFFNEAHQAEGSQARALAEVRGRLHAPELVQHVFDLGHDSRYQAFMRNRGGAEGLCARSSSDFAGARCSPRTFFPFFIFSSDLRALRASVVFPTAFRIG